MFKSLSIKPIYSTYEDNVGETFYNPILKQAVKFDRVSAYFSAKSLAQYSRGLEFFSRKGYKYRLIISSNIEPQDFDEIKEGYRLKSKITENMLSKLREELSLEEEKNISNLAYLISIGIIEIKFAFTKRGIFHDKCGMFWDEADNIICFRGSNNETEAALNSNYEAFTVTCSWLTDNQGFYEKIITKSISEFTKLWDGIHPYIKVLKADEVIMSEILKHNKNELILEEVLLRENCVVLDYVDTLILRINMEDDFWITGSSFYKIRLKKYVENMQGKKIIFKSTLTYIDYEKIHQLISRKAKSEGIEYFATNRMMDYIEARNIYIEKRAKLGIEIKNQDDKLKDKFKKYSEIVNSNMTRELREKQLWDSFFMLIMRKSGNFSVPGSGKTSSVLGVYAFLKASDIAKKIVMVGPKNAFGSWIDEFETCFKGKEELRLFNIHDKKYKSIASKKRALLFETGNANLLLFNYECLGTYLEQIKELIDDNTILVFDEVHKVKAIEGQYANNVLDIVQKAYYIIAMTGTPIPNAYTDIYNFLHILYNDEYREFFNFDLQMLKKPNKEELDDINKKIQPFFCRTTKVELKVPEVNPDEIIYVNATKEEQRLFEIVSAKYRKNILALFIRVLQLESNPRMLMESLDESDFKKILDITDNIDDIDFRDYSEDVKALISNISITSKMSACIKNIQKLVRENKKVIVWCIFKDSIRHIHKYLQELSIKSYCIYGEVELEERLTIIDDFKNGKFEVLITNPHTLAESVSLHSVCHDAIYFEYSYNLVHLLQSKDRIHRLGLPDKQYTQYYYLQDIFKIDGQDYSLDEQVYIRLLEKEQIMLNAIENNKLEEVTTSEEDLEIIFKNFFYLNKNN